MNRYYLLFMAISVDLASEAIVIAAFVLTAFAIPKLITYFSWALIKMWIYKNLDRVTRKKFFKSLIKGDVYEELVKEADKPIIRVKWFMQAYLDYSRDIKEPIVEGMTAIVLIVVISTCIGLESPVSLIFMILAVLLVIMILASLLTVKFIAQELSKLKKETEVETTSA